MRQLLIDFSPFCIKSALVDKGKLVELIPDFPEKASLVGNIYSAKVADIVKKQFAFLTIDDSKKGLLQLDDYKQEGMPPLVQGGSALVQVIRDSALDKGPIISCELSFPGRYLVLVKSPLSESWVKVSQKIACPLVREELKSRLEGLCPEGFGIIARTNAGNASPEIITREIEVLHNIAVDIIEKGKYTKAPSLLYGNEKVYAKTLKELLDIDIDQIVISSQIHLEDVKSIAKEYADFTNIQLHTGDLPLFDAYGIESQAARTLHSKIWLNCGGYILIEENQTCTYMDVNTGKYSSKKSFDEVSHVVNMEAAEKIAAQIRLKNISGIIIIDFINSRSDETAKELKAALKATLRKDRNPAVIADWSTLNIVQLTRKHTRPSLQSSFTDICPACIGTGRKPNTLFIADKIYKEIIKIYSGGFYDRIVINAHVDIAEILKKANMPYGLSLEINTVPEAPRGFYKVIGSYPS